MWKEYFVLAKSEYDHKEYLKGLVKNDYEPKGVNQECHILKEYSKGLVKSEYKPKNTQQIQQECLRSKVILCIVIHNISVFSETQSID